MVKMLKKDTTKKHQKKEFFINYYYKMKRILAIRVLSTLLLIFSFLRFVWKDWKNTLKIIYKKAHYLIKKIINISSKSKESILTYINKVRKTKNKISNSIKTKEKNDIDLWNKDESKKIGTKKKPNSHNKKILEQIISKANLYKKKWQLKQYEKKLIEGLAIDPDNIDCNKKLALFYHNTEEDKKAILLLKKVIKINPTDHETFWQLWDIYLVQWEFDIAKKLINEALAMAKDRPKYYISMVEIYYNEWDIDEAIWYMHKAIALRPRNTTYIMWLAWLYEELEDIENAKKYYFQVLELEPTNSEAKKKLNSL